MFDIRRQPARVAIRHAGPYQAFQRLLRGLPGRVGLGRILVLQLVQAEPCPRHDLEAAGDGFGIGFVQARDLVRRFKLAVAKPFALEPGRVDGDAFADAGHHVLQDAPLRHVVQHVAGDHGRDASRLRAVGQGAQPHRVAGSPAQGQRKIATVTKGRVQAGKVGGLGVLRRQQDGEQPVGLRGEVVPAERARPLPGPALAQRQQPAQPGVGGSVNRVHQHRHAVRQIQPAADHQPHAKLHRPLMRPHDSGQRVAIGDGECGQPHGVRLQQQLLHMAGAAEEGVVGGDLQFGVAAMGHQCLVRVRRAQHGALPQTP